MKRTYLSVLGLLLATMLVLAACGGGAQPAAQPPQAAAPAAPAAEVVTIKFIGGANVLPNELKLVEEDFEAATGIKAEWVKGPDSATDRLAQYLQFLGAGSGDLDVYQIDVIWPGILAEHMVDLSEYFTAEEMSEYFSRIVQNNTVDGQLVGVPWFTDAGLLYYRSDLLEKYGYTGPPVTWAELEEMATTIQEGERVTNPDFWGFVWQGQAYEGLTCDALEWQVSWGGGEIVEADGTISINNPQAAAAFDMAARWVGTISPPGVVSYREEDARNIWQGGNAAFMRNWPYAYALGNSDDSVIKGNFGVVPLPMGEGSDARHADTLGGWQLAVSKYSRHIPEAVEFVRFVTSHEGQKARATGGMSSLPTRAALYEDPDVLADNPFFGELLPVFTGGAVARPSTVTGEQYNQVSTIYFTEVNRVLTGQQTGQQAVESIEAQLKSLLQ